MSRDKILSVDPGSNGTGFALWTAEGWGTAKSPILTGNLYPRGSKKDKEEDDLVSWRAKCRDIIAKLEAKVDLSTVRLAWIEFPQNMESLGGRTAAKTGSVVKLAVFTGMLSEALFHHGVSPVFVEVNTWKGQMPKDLVARRVCRALGVSLDTFPAHSMDAVGIGLWAQNLLS